MIRICVLLLCFFVGLAHAKDAKTCLLQSLPLTEMDKKQSVEAELAPLVEAKAKAKGIKLIGKSFTTRGKQGQIITQFAFGGIEKKTEDKKEKRQVVLLKKPAVGAVIAKDLTEISPQDSIPLQYTEADLTTALDDLLAGRNLAVAPKTFNADNPLGVGDGSPEADLAAKQKSTLGALSSGLAAAQDAPGGNKDQKQGEGAQRVDILNSEAATKSGGSGKTQGSSGGVPGAGSGTVRQGEGYALNNPNNMAAGQHGVPPGVQVPGAGGADREHVAPIDPNPHAVPRNGAAQREGDGFPMGQRAGADIPPIFGERRGAPDLDARRNAEARREQPVPDQAPHPAAEEAALPRVDFRTTCDGCPPRVDRIHNKVIIQEKTLRLEDDVVVHTGACEDTLDFYDINKDFLCEGCDVLVDNVRRVAFDKYKAFWINGQNEKIVLDAEPQTDITEPHPFIEEASDCGYDIDEALGLAYPKIATVFSDRFNGKHVVDACHRSPEAAGIRLTNADCPVEHEFAANRSFLRKKKVFSVDGVEHIAVDCARVGEAIPHEFITAACQPILDPQTGAITPLARRRIRIPAGNQFITECEPLADTNLVGTTDGCEDDLFNHDFVTGRSYFNKRYYYNAADGHRVYCTGCLRSSEMIAHEYEPAGYQHDDVRHSSLRTAATFIAFQLLGLPQRVRIAEPEVRAGAEAIAHTLVSTENRVNGAPVYQGCHRVTQSQVIQHYSRPDGTTYDVVAGLGVPVQGPNECRYETRYKVLNIDTAHGYNGYTLIRFDAYKTVVQVFPGGQPLQIVSTTHSGRGRGWMQNSTGDVYNTCYPRGTYYRFMFKSRVPDSERWSTLENMVDEQGMPIFQ